MVWNKRDDDFSMFHTSCFFSFHFHSIPNFEVRLERKQRVICIVLSKRYAYLSKLSLAKINSVVRCISSLIRSTFIMSYHKKSLSMKYQSFKEILLEIGVIEKMRTTWGNKEVPQNFFPHFPLFMTIRFNPFDTVSFVTLLFAILCHHKNP